MKKIYIVALSLAVLGMACKPNPKPKNDGEDSTDNTVEVTEESSSKILSEKSTPLENSPFSIRLEEVKNTKAPSLQSFAFAEWESSWLMVGGRTNGFHGTSDRESTFPTKYSNTNIFVYSPVNNQVWKMAIPEAYRMQLQSTNMNHIHSGDYLYCVGGYGSTCETDSPDCYQTFPNLTAINIPKAIAAIKANDAAGLEAAISTLEDERMRVTGGALRKIGDWYYLVMGQNYNVQYKGGVTGIYTDQVRKFQIENTNGTLAIKNYAAYNEPWNETPEENNQFHRRDLTVTQSILADGTAGITVYGGVFTMNGGAFTNPVYIHQDGNSTSFSLDQGFSQKFNLYECANVPMYDPTSKTMYTVLLGGITDFYYDKSGALMPGNPLNALPFSKNVTTIIRNANGTSVEMPQKTPALPAFIGSDAEFIPNNSLAMYNAYGIIDFSKLPKTETTEVLLGAMYGGILATAEQSSEFNPTYASSKIYNVYLTW